MPGDDRLHEGVGAASRGDGDGIVGEDGERAVEVLLIDVAQGFHEGVVLTVACGSRLVLLAVDLDLHIGARLESVGGGDDVADELHLVVGRVVFEDVADDVGQVLLCDDLLLVAQLGDALCDALGLLGRELQAQFLEVLGDVGTTGVLSEGILAFASEALGLQLVLIEVALGVAIGMNARHLGEDTLAHDGHVGSDANAAICRHHATDVVEPLLADAGAGVEMVLQDDLHTCQRRVSTSLAQSVDRDVQAFGTTQDGRQRVGDSQVVVVVGVEVEVHIGVAFDHLAHVLDALQGVHDAEGIGEHEAADGGLRERVHELIDIVEGIAHARAPVFEIYVDEHALLVGILHALQDVGDVLLGGLAQLLDAMFTGTFHQHVDHASATRTNPVDGEMSVDKPEHLHPIQAADALGIAANHAHGVFLAFGYTRRSHLDAVDIDLAHEFAGNHQLLVRKERDAIGLLTIAQRAIHDLYERTRLHARLDGHAVGGTTPTLFIRLGIHLFCCSHASVLS